MLVFTGGLYFLVCVTTVLCRPEVDIQSRIVGGTTASSGAYPYQVSVRENNGHICGGSIISKNVILTAAHCIASATGTLTVLAGTSQIDCEIGNFDCGETYAVSVAIYHDLYNSTTSEHDVAIIKLQSDIQFPTFVLHALGFKVRVGPPTAIIPLADSDPLANTTAVLTGWGDTSYPNGSTPNDLQELQLTILDLPTCAQSAKDSGINYQITTAHVCTIVGAGQGACTGDSGGPLVQNGVQVGIASWVMQYCGKGYPDVFASVAFYKEWIETNSK